MAKIKLDHTRLDTPGFITRMREINTALGAGGVFAPLNPKLLSFTSAVNALETKNNAYIAAVQAARAVLTERDTARVNVENLARTLASASEGETSDDAQLQSGGWHLRGTATVVGPMPAPQNLSGTGGDQVGEADLVWEPVEGRDTYIAEQSASATGPWTQFYVGKKSSTTATGLTSGTLYCFRVRAVGAAGPGPWSDITQARAT